MTEQANTGWGMTVSRRFDTEAQAKGAVDSLRQAGFIEQEISVWQQRDPAEYGNEDGLERTFEGFLGGAVIGGLVAMLLAIALTWAANERVDEELAAMAAIAGAVAGGIIVAIAVNILSRRISFSHPHEEEHRPGSVVTVQVGERESQAREVFDKLEA